ncbi:RsmE family RNA methyltransferase [uncultured Leuconostoc sp.]|uniref:RsmE family RNA methyltransferase n=1 Tax=uncultured Leuconostoc sp. TaxID=173262 RepID=UPI0025FEE3EF|nr:RsmE family RNA methyltransferase [uncultured Leuconostoc sp.]
MQRYFLKNLINSEHITLTRDQDVFNHFGKVLRARVGSQAEFVSADLKVVIGEVIAIDETKITLTIKERLESNVELPIDVTIIVSPLKNDRSEWLVQKATELGVNRIIFAEMSRTVVDWKKQQAKKIVRLQKIAQAAAEQSHRLLIPEVKFSTWQNVLELPKQIGLVAWEESARTGEISTLVKSINEMPINTDVNLIFGPEGGLTSLEIEELMHYDYQPAGLGPRILRAETAPLYALSAISVLRELNE